MKDNAPFYGGKRIERAKSLLAGTELPMTEVGAHSGFGDQSAFTRSFQQNVGMSPGRWRRDHRGKSSRSRDFSQALASRHLGYR
jgi:AraC-like DNA-binding protein